MAEDEASAIGNWHGRLDASTIGMDESFTSDQGHLLSTLNDTADWTKWISPEKAASESTKARQLPAPTTVVGGHEKAAEERSWSLGGQGLQSLSRPSSRGSATSCPRGGFCSCIPGSNCRGACKPLPGLHRAGSKPRMQANRGPGFGRRANSLPARVPLPPAMAAAGLHFPPEGDHRPHLEVPPMICARIACNDATRESKPESRPPTAPVERKPGPAGQPLSWSVVGAGPAQQLRPGGYFGIVGSGGSGSPVELGVVLAEPKLFHSKGQTAGQQGRRCRSAAAARAPVPVPCGKVSISVNAKPVRGSSRPTTPGSLTKGIKADAG